eukprot:TRINITY_DN3656_c0_g1_i1.p4 TRINITY_DN3656_c0_g1~~TRINITY_DN3656_c0_g1_i1.p4  ORF type:complete len:133 (-),score=17.29 TRINITY_DN3656_c0_g1_i1:131-529(-)
MGASGTPKGGKGVQKIWTPPPLKNLFVNLFWWTPPPRNIPKHTPDGSNSSPPSQRCYWGLGTKGTPPSPQQRTKNLDKGQFSSNFLRLQYTIVSKKLEKIPPFDFTNRENYQDQFCFCKFSLAPQEFLRPPL